MSSSYATALRCIECGATHALDYRLECATCRGLLELQYDWDALRRAGPGVLEGRGLWRYAPVLPIEDPAHRVTLGEGQSPLLPCPA
ncbi:MAG: threonine synthase, partial [Candidatus Rokuibacteriota bacterium]